MPFLEIIQKMLYAFGDKNENPEAASLVHERIREWLYLFK